MKKRVSSAGIAQKKKHGQYFLRDPHVVLAMFTAVQLDANTSIFEIGCGDGFLTRRILQNPITRLWVFEIDPEWAGYVERTVKDERLTMHQQDFLTVDMNILKPYAPWTVLANLPYHLSFPMLGRLKEYRHLLREGVIMLQEEVAQKLVKQRGRGYGYVSLFFQHFFELRLLDKVLPRAFHPQPKVFSRLLYFKPKSDLQPIKDEEQFWQFIKACFAYPRRTLRNNLMQTAADLAKIPDHILALRAQQMGMDDFLQVWSLLCEQS